MSAEKEEPKEEAEQGEQRRGPPEGDTVADRYLAALDAGDLDAVLELFADGAVVRSPLQGEVGAEPFFRDLFERTARSDIDVVQTFESRGEDPFAAAYFEYDWTLEDGRSVTFDCMDVFELDGEGRIVRLTLLFDGDGVRRALEDAD